DHRSQIAPLGEVERMAAVGAEDDVAGTQGGADADGDRLLADREMNRALDAVGRIEPGDLLLDPANPAERSMQRREHDPPPERLAEDARHTLPRAPAGSRSAAASPGPPRAWCRAVCAACRRPWCSRRRDALRNRPPRR